MLEKHNITHVAKLFIKHGSFHIISPKIQLLRIDLGKVEEWNYDHTNK